MDAPLERTMPIQHPRLEDWQQQLANLDRLIEAGGPSDWHYEIRAKILKYFISCYGHQTFSENEVARSYSGRGEQKAYFSEDESNAKLQQAENLLQEILYRYPKSRAAESARQMLEAQQSVEGDIFSGSK